MPIRDDSIALSERDIYLRIIDELKILRDLFRGMAALRKDTRWLKAASLMDAISDNAKALYNKKTGITLATH